MRKMSSHYAILGGSSTNKSYNVQPSQNKRRRSNSTGTRQDKTRVTEEDQISVQPLPEYCGTFEVTGHDNTNIVTGLGILGGS